MRGMDARRRHLLALLFAATLASTAWVALAASAQDDTEEAEGGAATDTGPPRTTGRSEATAAVGQAGMTFELHNKARIVIPPRLPIGSSRRMRFAESRTRPTPAEIAPGFTRIGPVLSFDGAINATSDPVVVSIRQPADPARRGTRLVIAMEQATVCGEGSRPLEGVTGLCSGWELIDAEWSASEGRLMARLRTPGGHRLVFGTVPLPETAE